MPFVHQEEFVQDMSGMMLGGVWFLDETSSEPSRQQGQTVKKAIIAARLPMRVR